ncbi:hypothetical protein L0Y81_30040 (plasmid) [Burkholderia multivorans]|uniref:Uncharacterized protein n=2 Tax=Burkholderia multivorans TaxID=87883 RepID=A0A0H3KSH2_BURM1|nr:hypothetical protein [Burkholderia multivorans]EGC97797.1 hypothetical protein B1M_44844 [Burkholderia sp. TJI49]ELK7722866.1 hypothetical protein [Burkholderia cenocepacia]ABX19846.1 hypothetical protein Bmul_6193 [Burkholderia multivorans ATCC 17616]MBR8048904.1 hypothetical protein [Burkholderia multivorans]MBR8453312.1 hypothetical protein [Burkholderia multivorans]
MVETIEIGPAPCDEACAQVGDMRYLERSRAECTAFINQIRRTLGEPPDGASLFIKSSAHDFGTYWEVVVKVTGGLSADAREAAIAYAYRCESESPTTWDDDARRELTEAGFPVSEVV